MNPPSRVRRLVGALTVALTTSIIAPLGSLPAAQAAPSPTLRVSDARPIRGEVVRIRADLPGRGARPIRLQRKSGKRWVTVAKKRSNHRVAATFTRRVGAKPVVYRAVAQKGSTRHVSRRISVRPRAQSARLGIPQKASPGETLRAVAVFAPARVQRPVLFQQHIAGTWRTVAKGRQNRAGQAVATIRFSAAARYRVVAQDHRGAKRVVSSTVTVTLAKTAPPPAPPPDLRCDLPAGGTVEWGAHDGTHTMGAVARLDVATDDGLAITSKDEYSHSTMTLTEPGSGPVSLGARLRLRGNSTSWVSLKYPYKVKLDTSSSVLGMPKSKDWVLLANFYDRALLRNDVGFELARRLDAPWAARMQPVELWLNGTYKGLYQWGEGIEEDGDRVDLAPGAVLLEADAWDDTDPRFETPRGLQVYVKSTEDPATVARAGNRVRLVEDVLYSGHYAHPAHGYRSCLDVDSFVDAYLTAELTKNIDAGFNNSVWMVLGADGRLAMGPAWDFDQGMGNRRNCEIDDPQGWFINRRWLDEQPVEPTCFPTQLRGAAGHWYQRLMTDPWFVDRVRARWSHVRTSLAGLPGYVDASATTIEEAAERNFGPVDEGGAGMPLGPTLIESITNHVFRGTWAAEAAGLREWLADRVAWLDEQFS